MKHHIRINGEVKTLDCEIGSGRFDWYGHEIFEGDIVWVSDGFISRDGTLLYWTRNKAFFRRGDIILVDEKLWDCWQTAGCIPSSHISSNYVIVSDTMPTDINIYKRYTS